MKIRKFSHASQVQPMVMIFDRGSHLGHTNLSAKNEQNLPRRFGDRPPTVCGNCKRQKTMHQLLKECDVNHSLRSKQQRDATVAEAAGYQGVLQDTFSCKVCVCVCVDQCIMFITLCNSNIRWSVEFSRIVTKSSEQNWIMVTVWQVCRSS